MAQITNTIQLSLFTLLKTVIKANSTLSVKFNDKNIVQYEVKHKSANFFGFPYIFIRVPTTETEFITLNHQDTEKSFDAEIVINMDYMAKDNFLNYANALIYAIESNEASFESNGYFNAEINVRSVQEMVEDNKDLIVGTFVFSASGSVGR